MSPRAAARALACVALFAFTRCIATPAIGDTELDLQLGVFDAQGQASDTNTMPRRPRLVLTAKPALAKSPAPMLFTGSADADLLRDLDRLPLTSLNARRLLPSSIASSADGSIRIVPDTTLARGSTYTFAVARSALPGSPDSAFTAELHTDDSALAGAAVSGSFPADGSAGVASALPLAWLTFDGLVDGVGEGIWLEDAVGLAVPAEISVQPCAALETDAETCVELGLQATLEPLTHYSLRSGRALHDAHGAEVEPFTASFSTDGVDDDAPLIWSTGTCALDETTLPIGCALIGDHDVQLRMQPSGLARIVAALGEQSSARLSSGTPVEMSFRGLTPSTAYALHVTAADAAGTVTEVDSTLTTTSELAALSITEVRADPLGSEPAQEYVELLNFGATSIDVQDFTLSDSPDQLETKLPASPALPAGARALIVPATFDAASTLDAAPAPGALLLRTAAALTRSGLANAGEPLFLRDREGRRLSAAPATPPPRPGICITRSSADPRTGAPGSFDYDAAGGCTPGR
jgi:hypothetical protein